MLSDGGLVGGFAWICFFERPSRSLVTRADGIKVINYLQGYHLILFLLSKVDASSWYSEQSCQR